MLTYRLYNRLCTYIRKVVFTVDVDNRKLTRFDELSYGMVVHIHMFALIIESMILSDIDCASIVTPNCSRNVLVKEFNESSHGPEKVFRGHREGHIFSFGG